MLAVNPPVEEIRDQIAGISAGARLGDNIVARLNAPGLYYSASRLLENLDELIAIQRHDPQIAFAYAAKACTLRPVMQMVAATNLKVEVQSMHEMRQARRVGISGERFVWNSPRKKSGDMEVALSEGATVILDSPSEAEDVIEFAGGRSATISTQIGIRVMLSGDGYFSTGAGKLGMPIGDAVAVVRRLQVKGIAPGILHCHALARVEDLAVYKTFLNAVTNIVREVRGATGHIFSTVDLGGGFNSRSALESQNVKISDFVELACHSLLQNNQLGIKYLCFEPGRYVVEDAAFALGTVVRRKVSNGRQWIIVDVSTNLLVPIPLARFNVAGLNRSETMPTCIVDGTCSPSGVIVGNCAYPPVEEGALIVFRDCGAYSAALMEPFLEPPAPIYWIENDAIHEVVSSVSAGRATDLFQGFAAPV